MKEKEYRYSNARQKEERRRGRKKQPFFKAYHSIPEDYDLSEPVDKQIDALHVELGFSPK